MGALIEEFVPELELQMFEEAEANIRKPRLHSVNIPQKELFVQTIKLVVPAFIGMLMIWFGLTSTGSYYTSATKFGGLLAEIFYSWQVGTFMAMVGSIVVYDAIKRSGYL